MQFVRVPFYGVAVIVFLCACGAWAAKPRVGVLDFVPVGVSAGEAQAVGNLFRGDLVSSGIFDVIDRANMDAILKEQAFQTTGCTETACAVQIGKMLNMEYMLYGSVTRLGQALFVQVEVVSVETSRIILSSKEKFNNLENADFAVSAIIGYLKSKILTFTPAASVTTTVEPPKKQGKDLVLLFSGAGAALAGIACNSTGYYFSTVADTAYTEYMNAAADIPAKWQAYDGARIAGNVFYIGGYALYAAAAGLITWWFLLPEPPAVSLMPIPGGAALTVAVKF